MWTAGHTDVDILTAIMTGGSSPGGYDPAEWSSITNSSSDDNTLALPDGPYRLTLRQVDADAATEIPLPANGISQLGMLKDGEATVGRASDGTLSIIGAQTWVRSHYPDPQHSRTGIRNASGSAW